MPPTRLGCLHTHAHEHAAATKPAFWTRCRSQASPGVFFPPPHRLSLPQDNATGVLWWVLSVCDPAAFTPGKDEAAGRGNPAGYAKERNIVLRWDALDAMLQKVADADGDAERYRNRTWPDGQWWWWLLPGQQLRLAAAGPQRAGGPRWTKMMCPSISSSD